MKPTTALVASALFLAALAGAATPATGQDHPPAVQPAAGDVMILRDGRRLEGAVVAESPESVTFRSGGVTRVYARDEIVRVEKLPDVPPSAAQPATPAAPPAPGSPPATAPEKRKESFGKKGKVLSEAARGWVRELARSAETEDEQVRRSVAAGLRALGPAAVTAIEEAAAAASTPAAREFLGRVAADLRGDRASASPPRSGVAAPAPAPGPGPAPAPAPAPAAPPTTEPGGSLEPGAPPAAPSAKSPPAPAAPAPEAPGRRLGRGLLDRLVADLELRDEQRPRMEEVLGGIERGQFGLMREARQGALTSDQLAARIEELRSRTLEAARGFLDATQMDLFEERAQRYFDGLLVRATRGEGKAPAPPAPAPAPPTPPAPAPKPGE